METTTERQTREPTSLITYDLVALISSRKISGISMTARISARYATLKTISCSPPSTLVLSYTRTLCSAISRSDRKHLLLFLLILRSRCGGHAIEGVSDPPSFGVLHYTKPLGIFDADAPAYSSRETADAVCVEGVQRSKSESAPTTTIFSDRFSSSQMTHISMTYFAQTALLRKNERIYPLKKS
jgi:hypothetical protein